MLESMRFENVVCFQSSLIMYEIGKSNKDELLR